MKLSLQKKQYGFVVWPVNIDVILLQLNAHAVYTYNTILHKPTPERKLRESEVFLQKICCQCELKAEISVEIESFQVPSVKGGQQVYTGRRAEKFEKAPNIAPRMGDERLQAPAIHPDG